MSWQLAPPFLGAIEGVRRVGTVRNTRLQKFIVANPKVKAWNARLGRKSTETATVFTSGLMGYWDSRLSTAFKSLTDWETQISDQSAKQRQ